MLSTLGQIVRRHDPDRFFTALFAPPEHREALFLLYAFNHELARAREVASEPTIALIRLQWWREVVEGAPRRHEVAEPLLRALGAGVFQPAVLLEMIDGREAEAGIIETLPEWRAYLLATAGGVAVAAAVALGAPPALLDATRNLGAAYGAAGLLRAMRVVAAQQRCLLPADVLARHGLSPEAVTADPAIAALAGVRLELAAQGQDWLRLSRGLRLPRPAHVAVLPAALARRDMRRIGAARPRGFGDRMAVLIAAATGRI